MLKVTELKQKIAEKETFEISKFSESPLVFSKNRLIAARFRKLRSTGFTKELKIWKQKILPKSIVFSVCLLTKIEEIFFAPLGDYKNTDKMLRVFEKHQPKAFSQVQRLAGNYRRDKNN